LIFPLFQPAAANSARHKGIAPAQSRRTYTVVLRTDAVSAGINLQRAHLAINYAREFLSRCAAVVDEEESWPRGACDKS